MQQTFTVEEAAKLISAASGKKEGERLTAEELLRIADSLGVDPEAVQDALTPDAEQTPVDLKLNFPVMTAWAAWTMWTFTVNQPVTPMTDTKPWGWHANYLGSFIAVPLLLGMFCGRKFSTCLLSAVTGISTQMFVRQLTKDAPLDFWSSFAYIVLAVGLTTVGSMLTEYFLRFRSHQR